MKPSARTITILLVAIGIMALCPGRSFATGERHTHDGLLLRMCVGFGLAAAGAELPTDLGDISYTLSGASGIVDFALGGNLARNLSLHWSLTSWTVTNPSAEAKLGDVSVGGELGEDTSLSVTGTGIGITYYIMPVNLYLSATLGAAQGSLAVGDEIEGETDSGLALRFMLGKEWWVGSNWALGLAGVFDYQSLPQETTSGEEATWKTVNFGLLFSATYD